MSAYGIVEVAATVTSIPFAVVGFGVTIWQVRRAKSAAEQAKSAALEMRDRIGRSSLLMLIPQLRKAEEEIDQAVMSGNVDLAISWVSTWRWQCCEVKGILQVLNSNEQKVMRALQTSITASAEAKSRLMAGSTDVLLDTESVRSSISKVTAQLGPLGASYGMQGGD